MTWLNLVLLQKTRLVEEKTRVVDVEQCHHVVKFVFILSSLVLLTSMFGLNIAVFMCVRCVVHV